MKSGHSIQAEWLRTVVEEHAAPLTRYAAVILGDADQARDVAQDTFVRLFREDRAKVESHLAEWLFTVCRNRALDVLRKEKRMKPLSETEMAHYACPDPTPALAVERNDTHNQLLEMLGTLPPNQQEVVRLKFQNGLSYAEISRITQLTVSNVGFLIHRAIKSLRQQMQAEADSISNL